jgi:two-component system, chemotaxis family, protein-glutamate methylesterase/glutaminase
VLVVDDSAFMRKVVSELVDGCGGFRVVGTARDGVHALAQIRALDPDIVTLDVEMPEMDGLTALGAIMREARRPVVMLSAAGSANASALTIRALELGAVDFVQKPSGPISLDLATVKERLYDALRAATCVNLDGVRQLPPLPSVEPPSPPRVTADATRVVVIAASTGGPSALAGVIPALPRDLDAAVLVVQHMPRGFTLTLAQRLGALSTLDVCEAAHGDRLVRGRVYVAPGGAHMLVARDADGARIALDDGPSVWGVRPSADPMFRSAVEAFGPRIVAAVLTGMGRDGAEGLRLVRRAGGRGVVQDRASSVVYGMPREALAVAGAERVAALADVPTAILELLAELPADAEPRRAEVA